MNNMLYSHIFNSNLKFRIFNKNTKVFDYVEIYNGHVRFSYYDEPDTNLIFNRFTEIQDQSGRPIYEGDIIEYVEASENGRCWEKVMYVVFYNPNLSSFRCGGEYVLDNYNLGAKGKVLNSSCKLVGNIFENESLIK